MSLISSGFRSFFQNASSPETSPVPSPCFNVKIPVFLNGASASGDGNGDDDTLDLPRPDFFVWARSLKESDLSCVGLQVWVASVALCDYLLDLYSDPQALGGTVFLELGCGVGLPSLVLSKAAHFMGLSCTAFMTDVGGPVLDNARLAAERAFRDCQRRKRRGEHRATLPHEQEDCVDIRVRELDWTSVLSRTSFRKWKPVLLACGWTSADVETLGAAVAAGKLVVLAADPVYDESLTEGLVGVLYELSEAAQQIEVFIAMERRVNFLAGDTVPRAVHYEHFWNELRGRCVGLAWERLALRVPPVHVPCPQVSESIELWRIHKKKEPAINLPLKHVV